MRWSGHTAQRYAAARTNPKSAAKDILERMLSAPEADVDEVEEALVVRLVLEARVVPAALKLVEFCNDVYVGRNEVVGMRW
jgi:hypothetical protein